MKWAAIADIAGQVNKTAQNLLPLGICLKRNFVRFAVTKNALLIGPFHFMVKNPAATIKNCRQHIPSTVAINFCELAVILFSES